MTSEWQYDSKQNAGRLKIAGPLTILQVAALKSALVDAFEQAERVDIDLSAVAEIDVAGLQLLCAGHHYAKGRKQQMTLRIAGNRVVLDLVGEAGLRHELFEAAAAPGASG